MYNQQRVFGKRTPLRVVGNRPFLSTLQKNTPQNINIQENAC